MSKMSNVNT